MRYVCGLSIAHDMPHISGGLCGMYAGCLLRMTCRTLVVAYAVCMRYVYRASGLRYGYSAGDVGRH
jgi:hypothetical protein